MSRYCIVLLRWIPTLGGALVEGCVGFVVFYESIEFAAGRHVMIRDIFQNYDFKTHFYLLWKKYLLVWDEILT